MNDVQRKIVLFFLKRYKNRFVSIFLLASAVAVAEAVTLALLVPLLGGLIGGGTPGRLALLINAVLGSEPLGPAAVGLLVLAPVRAGLTIVHDYVVGKTSGIVQYDARRELIEKYAAAPYEYLVSQKQGRLQHIVLNSTNYLGFFVSKAPQLALLILRAAAIVALLFIVQPKATLLLAGGAVVFNFVVSKLAKGISYGHGKIREASAVEQRVIFGEIFGGFKQLSVYGVTPRWLGRFDEQNELMSRLFGRDVAWMSAPKNILEGATIALAAAAAIAARRFAPESVAQMLPIAATFGAGLLKLVPALTVASRMWLEIVNYFPEIETLNEAYNVKFDRKPQGSRPFRGLADTIRFEKVVFAYAGRRPVLDGLDLSIPRRTTTAIVGDSGSGKTTVANLLLRLFDPQAGRILVDGVELTELDARQWLSKIGFVSQDGFLYHASIMDNIVFGRTGFTKADVERAARVAHADEFIRAMPQGYDTLAGELGLKLSGGQQQRIAIARAVLGDPELLILDEATSALDTVSETAVQTAIAEASGGRTVIQIAHRLSTVRDADNIVVLEQGRLAEQGKHDELIAREGAYARFVAAQKRA